jgi:hypothetical protein
VGDLDPVTKLRNGDGVYTFENPFFQYKGQYVNGTKEGQGVLLLRDGSRYEGTFSEGEITGTGERVYTDGNVYRGDFYLGERHGYGEMDYRTPRAKEIWYKGQWNLNIREGQGTLQMKDKNTYTVIYNSLNLYRAPLRITGPMGSVPYSMRMAATMRVRSLRGSDMAKALTPSSSLRIPTYAWCTRGYSSRVSVRARAA